MKEWRGSEKEQLMASEMSNSSMDISDRLENLNGNFDYGRFTNDSLFDYSEWCFWNDNDIRKEAR